LLGVIGLAKDGTARGNRAGNMTQAGRKPAGAKAMPGFPAPKTTDVPEDLLESLPGFMSAAQKMGGALLAPQVYCDTVAWLDDRGCRGAVSEIMLQQYAQACARWIQLETMLSENGFLVTNTGSGGGKKVVQSPFLVALQNQLKIVNMTWYPIYQAVRETAAARYGGLDEDEESLDLLSNPYG